MRRPDPAVIGVVLAVDGLVAALVMVARREVHACLETAFWAMNVASVVGPLLALFAPRWWTAAGTAFLGWGALFLALPPLGNLLSGRQYGENAMVFLLPLVLFPGALKASALLRLAWWLWHRRTRAAAA